MIKTAILLLSILATGYSTENMIFSGSPAITAGNIILSPSSNGSVSINLTDFTNFGVTAFDLYYNPDVVVINNITLGFEGYGGSITSNINNSIGKSRVLILTSSIPGIDAPFTLANIGLQSKDGFHGINSGLNMTVETFADTDGIQYNPAVYNGSVNIAHGSINGNVRRN